MSDLDLEDLYRLSPRPAGDVFHALHAPPGSTAYFEQFLLTYGAELDLDASGALLGPGPGAASGAAELLPLGRGRRSGAARARRVELPFARLDWRELSEAERRRRLEDLLAEDRARGFPRTRRR